MIKFCPNCFKNQVNEFGCYNGYYWCLKEDVDICWINGCNCKLINIDFPESDLKILTKISNNPSFYQAMIDLHDKDIVEYELKMSQFRAQAEQQKSTKNEQINNDIQCPYCKSNNINKISSTSRVASTYLLGLGSKKIGKQWHCNKCGSDF